MNRLPIPNMRRANSDTDAGVPLTATRQSSEADAGPSSSTTSSTEADSPAAGRGARTGAAGIASRPLVPPLRIPNMDGLRRGDLSSAVTAASPAAASPGGSRWPRTASGTPVQGRNRSHSVTVTMRRRSVSSKPGTPGPMTPTNEMPWGQANTSTRPGVLEEGDETSPLPTAAISGTAQPILGRALPPGEGSPSSAARESASGIGDDPLSTAASQDKDPRRSSVSEDLPRNSTSSGRARASSIVSKIKESVAAREKRDRAGSQPVELEMVDESGVERELNDEMVGVLDCVDPQVSTVNHLQNVTNGILIPHLPALWSRRPEIVIHTGDDDNGARSDESQSPATGRTRQSSASRPRSSTVSQLFASGSAPLAPPTAYRTLASTTGSPLTTITSSAAADGAAAPGSGPLAASAALSKFDADGDVDDGASHVEDEMDTHVKAVLRSSKRQKAKQIALGFWRFVKTPMGLFTAVYGVLVVFWGAALVIILAGWFPMPDSYWKNLWVEICSQILNGLFTITGVGLIPWRVMDTYRMVIIAKLKRKTRRLRQQRGLPPIEDENDLPDPRDQADYVAVLSDEEQDQLRYQQERFAQSQTWYKPHATATHRAFPINWALWNTILMDGNSFFQCLLCGCMWGLNYHVRPAWTTGTLIPCSFLCGIVAGILIWQGSKRTKKIQSVEEQLRKALGVPLAIGMPSEKPPMSKDGTVIANSGERDLRLRGAKAETDAARSTELGARDMVAAVTGAPGHSGGDRLDRDETSSSVDAKSGWEAIEMAQVESSAAKEEDLNTEVIGRVPFARRSTVAFGEVQDPAEAPVAPAANGSNDGVPGRPRGATVAAPGTSAVDVARMV